MVNNLPDYMNNLNNDLLKNSSKNTQNDYKEFLTHIINYQYDMEVLNDIFKDDLITFIPLLSDSIMALLFSWELCVSSWIGSSIVWVFELLIVMIFLLFLVIENILTLLFCPDIVSELLIKLLLI